MSGLLRIPNLAPWGRTHDAARVLILLVCVLLRNDADERQESGQPVLLERLFELCAGGRCVGSCRLSTAGRRNESKHARLHTSCAPPFCSCTPGPGAPCASVWDLAPGVGSKVGTLLKQEMSSVLVFGFVEHIRVIKSTICLLGQARSK